MIDAARGLAAAIERTPCARRLGFRAGEVLADAATASVPYAASSANAQGFVHGGVAASLSVWTAMIVAVASDRAGALSSRPVSISVAYLAAAREEGLHATARVSSRGRDVVHAGIEIAGDRGRTVSVAQAVVRTLSAQPRVPAAAPPAHAAPPEGAHAISPFSRSMGMDVLPRAGDAATLSMRLDLNEGLGGAFDPGALVALADTCAAVACVPSIEERRLGSATLSLSAIFGPELLAPAVAVGRQVSEDGGLRSALVEVAADGTRRTHAMTACVTYRFVMGDQST